MAIRTGSYIGNAITARRIPTGNFEPKAVIVKSNASSSDSGFDMYVASLRTVSMVETKLWRRGSVDDAIEDLDSTDSFTVGINLNEEGVIYYWVAFGGDDVDVFTYTGDGLDDKTVTGLDFSPIAAWVWRDNDGHDVTCRTQDMPTDTSANPGSGAITDGIKSLDADGVTLGTSTLVNETAVTYYGLAFGSSDVQGTLVWLGDGSPVRQITGLSFMPSFVFVEGVDNTYPNIRFNTESPGSSLGIDYLEETAIRGFVSRGIEVNGYSAVNGDGNRIYAIAWAVERITLAALGSFTFVMGQENVEPQSDTGWIRDLSVQQTRNLGALRDSIVVMSYGSNTRQFVFMTTPARFLTVKLLEGTFQSFTDWSGDSRDVYVASVKTDYVRPFRARVTVQLVEQ